MATLGTVPLLRWMITLVIAAGFFACPCAQAKSTASVTAAVATPAPAKHACCAAPAEPEKTQKPAPAHDKNCPHCGRILTASTTADAGAQHLTTADLCVLEDVVFAPLAPVFTAPVSDALTVPLRPPRLSVLCVFLI